MSGAITWILCSGSPATIAYSVRCACGACVVHHSCSLPVTASIVGDRAARLQRRGVHALERDVLRDDDDVGVGEDRVGLGLVARLPVEDVVVGLALLVVADHRRVGVERAARRRRPTGSGSYSTSISSSASRAA